MTQERKYLDEYNYHDWAKFMVREPKDKPTVPHFASVLFDSHSISLAGCFVGREIDREFQYAHTYTHTKGLHVDLRFEAVL